MVACCESAVSPPPATSPAGPVAELFGTDLEVAMVAGLPAAELARRLAVAARTGEACHRALAFYLHDMEARRAHQELGFATAVEFAHHRMHLSRGRARDLLLVGRKLGELRRLDGAFARGELPWSKVRRVARVAVPQTEQAWLERVRDASHDEVDALVGCAREGDAPAARDRGLPRARFVKRFVVDSLRVEMFERAREKLAAEVGRPCTDDDVFDEMLRLLLASDADGTVRGRKPVDGSLFKLAVRDGDAPPAPSDRAAAGADPVPEAGAEEDAAAASDAVVTGRLRRRVLARDGHRCRACPSRRSLMIHHVTWRSRGGPTTLDNLVTLCARCHGLVHDRWLRVARDEGGEFRFTDRHGQPLAGPHPHVGSAVRVTCATAHLRGEAEAGAAASTLLTEDDIPDVVDGAWWRAHEHMLEWRDGRVRVRRARGGGPG